MSTATATKADRPPRQHLAGDVVQTYRAEADRARSERAALAARWGDLAETDRARIRAAVERANPGLVRFPSLLVSLCYERMTSEGFRCPIAPNREEWSDG